MRSIAGSLLGVFLFTSTIHAQMSALPFWQKRSLVVETITTVGAQSWVVPPGVTKLESVEAWGGGGSAAHGWYVSNNASYGGGGGGGYSKAVNVTVTPGQSITVIVGAGGASVNNAIGNDGGDSSMGAFVLAKGGKGSLKDGNWDGGLGGLASEGTGNIKYSGGNGGGAYDYAAGPGGGGAASPTGNGGTGTNSIAYKGAKGGDSPGAGAGGAEGSTTTTPGAAGTTHHNGGGGAAGGGSDSGSTHSPGGAGGSPGGGGGSSGKNGSTAGAGGRGQIRITYWGY